MTIEIEAIRARADRAAWATLDDRDRPIQRGGTGGVVTHNLVAVWDSARDIPHLLDALATVTTERDEARDAANECADDLVALGVALATAHNDGYDQAVARLRQMPAALFTPTDVIRLLEQTKDQP